MNTSKTKFKLSGGSEATTDVSDLLDIYLSGGSRLVYSGYPYLGSMDISGGSSLHHQQ